MSEIQSTHRSRSSFKSFFAYACCVATGAAFLSASSPVDAMDIPPAALDGDTVLVGGQAYDLAWIKAPELTTRCIVAGRELACGVIARAALRDLISGANVTCEPSARSEYSSCRAGSYDLSVGMLHFGWAEPIAGAPRLFTDVAAKAKAKGHGMWRQVKH